MLRWSLFTVPCLVAMVGMEMLAGRLTPEFPAFKETFILAQTQFIFGLKVLNIPEFNSEIIFFFISFINNSYNYSNNNINIIWKSTRFSIT